MLSPHSTTPANTIKNGSLLTVEPPSLLYARSRGEGDERRRALNTLDRADAVAEDAGADGLVLERCAAGPLQAVNDLTAVGIHEHKREYHLKSFQVHWR